MKNSYDVDVGERIRYVRNKNNMSMKELGKKLGLHESTISRYEKGELSLDVKQVEELSKVLGVSSAYICGWQKELTDEAEKHKQKETDRLIKRWVALVGEHYFNDNELEELANYAKYIISKR